MATYKIKMFGVFASDLEAMLFGDDGLITFKKIQDDLKSANGSDIEVDLSSVGGYVDVGVDIFFMFRDYKRNNPQAQLILNIKYQAASMASMFASGEFWDLVTVEDISSYMIHNPANGIMGDYREMYKNAEYLERLTKLYSGVYAKKSKKDEKEIKKMMGETTYLFGKEIVDSGFADEILATTEDKNKDSAFAQMQLKYNSIMLKMQQANMKNEDLKRAAASLQRVGLLIEQTQPEKPATSGENNNQEDVNMSMTPDELKKANPDTFATVEMAGVDKERARVKSLAEMKKRKEFEGIPAIMERIDEGIEKGEDVNAVQVGLMALLSKNSIQASMESPGNLNAGSAGTPSGEKQAAEIADESY
jgi:ATP-dependent protease ClpP protease subunit